VARGSNGPEDSEFAVCQDFVGDGGISGEDGSCCKVDNALFDGWCLKVRLEWGWMLVSSGTGITRSVRLTAPGC